ncbi:sigma-70 family RNA polymerase sigma factor [Nocardioides aurantiacus]|nr:sigma-70 family RNA polymerase sigma factor [Nocardioides aurantiacus]
MAAGELTTEASPDPADGSSDADLIARVRDGDTDAFGTLFARHVGAAERLARALVRGPDADDLVSEAFTKTLVVLQGGGGPDEAFRAYLLTAVRRLHVDRIRRTRRVTTTDDLDELDDGVPFVDPAVAEFEGGAAARAFASLPERWQLVLWHLEVENDKPADIAPLLDLSPNSVSALAYRAREGLRQAFLTMHHTGDPEQLPAACTTTRGRLGGFVRGALTRRDARKVEDHLDRCLACTGVYLELREVNSSLSGLLGPVVLGSAAAAYLSGLGVGTGAVGGVAASAGATLGGRVRDAVVGHVGTVGTTVVAGAAVLAVVTGAALVVQDRTSTLEAPFARQLVSESPSPAGGGTPGPSTGRTGPATPDPTPAPSSPGAGATTPAATGGDPEPDTDPGAEPSTDPAPSPATGGDRDRPRGTGVAAGGVRRADLAVTATLAATTAGRARLQVTVSGVPAGQSAALDVRTSAGTLRPLGAGCTGGGVAVSCTATSARTGFALELTADVGTVVDLVLTEPDGWTDPVSTNNSVRLAL